MTVSILIGDVRERLAELEPNSFHLCCTSPPYYNLRDYQHPAQIGLEPTPDDYVAALVSVFRGVRRVLRDDGVVFLNLADTYASAPGQGTRGGPPSASSTLEGNGHKGGGPKLATLSRVGRSGNKGNGAADHGRRAAAPGLKPKDLIGIPWATAFALREDGWWLRSAIIWAKPNGMPGSQEDRCTSSYEMVFMLAKSHRYWSDFDAIKTSPRESTLIRTAQDVQAQAGSHRANGGAKTNGAMKAVGGRSSDKQAATGKREYAGFNDRWDAAEARGEAKPVMMRDVWFIPPAQFSEAHFAVMPDELAQRCILAGSPGGGSVLDPFGGAGTTGRVADRLGRDCTLIELYPEYAAIADRRLRAGLCRVDGPPAPTSLGPLFWTPDAQSAPRDGSITPNQNPPPQENEAA